VPALSTGWPARKSVPCKDLRRHPGPSRIVSYAFTGTLQQPYDGSTHFSGTLVYNTDLPTYPGIQPFPGWSYYSGVPADPSAPVSSLTFQIGNTPSSAFGTVSNLEVIVAHTQADVAFFLQEQFRSPAGQSMMAEFGIGNNKLVHRAPLTSLAPPSSLSLSDFGDGANLTLYGQTANGQWVNVVGTITSLTPVPEPSAPLVFAAFGLGLAGYRRAAGRGRSA
jgi:hypothetical protein